MELGSVLLIVATFFVLVWVGLLELLSRLGGWRRVADRYRATAVPEGRVFRMQHVAFGWLNYNGCVTIIVSPTGVYLSLWPLFRLSHPALLIPWSALHVVRIKSREFLAADVVGTAGAKNARHKSCREFLVRLIGQDLLAERGCSPKSSAYLARSVAPESCCKTASWGSIWGCIKRLLLGKRKP
jgi:hypothetical protein